MANSKLIIIAPTAPPNICGVSDYAYRIALNLEGDYESICLGVEDLPPGSVPNGVGQEGGKNVLQVLHWREAIENAVKSGQAYDLLLNYTPTSYAKTGLPIALLTGLKSFQKGSPQNRIFVFFHETWNGTPHLKLHHLIRDKFIKWSSLRISRLSSGISVITEHQKAKIQSILPESRIQINQVGANIYPADRYSGLTSERRKGEWVVFGLSHTRLWALKAHQDLIRHLLASGVMKKIRSIGPSDDTFAKQEAAFINEHFGENILEQLGALSTGQVSYELLTASGSLVGQTADSLRKSGSFAAMAAHGTPVVCSAPRVLADPPGSALFQPEELLADPNIISSDEGAGRIKRLHEWFWSTRSWEAISRDVKAWME